MWYMNHWNGVIENPEGRMWLDQGWCIGASGIAWGVVRFRGDISAVLSAMPTLMCCLIGGALAGVVVWYLQKGKESA